MCPAQRSAEWELVPGSELLLQILLSIHSTNIYLNAHGLPGTALGSGRQAESKQDILLSEKDHRQGRRGSEQHGEAREDPRAMGEESWVLTSRVSLGP